MQLCRISGQYRHVKVNVCNVNVGSSSRKDWSRQASIILGAFFWLWVEYRIGPKPFKFCICYHFLKRTFVKGSTQLNLIAFVFCWFCILEMRRAGCEVR